MIYLRTRVMRISLIVLLVLLLVGCRTDEGSLDTSDESLSVSEPILMYAKIFANDINIMSSYSPDSEIVGGTYCNDVFAIYDIYEDSETSWYKIQTHDGVFAWIDGKYCMSMDSEDEYEFDFKVIDDFLKEYDTEGLYEYLLYDYPMTYVLNTDMDLNGIIETVFIEVTDRQNTKIIYNDHSLEYELVSEGVGDIAIMDVDTSDSYLELVIMSDDLLSIDTVTSIYRLYNDEIVMVDRLDDCITHIDGDGRIYYWSGHKYGSSATSFDYDDVLVYYDFNEKKHLYLNNPIGKTYVTDYERYVFETLEDTYNDMGEERYYMTDPTNKNIVGFLEPGDEFVLLGLEENGKVFVEIEDGSRGYLSHYQIFVDMDAYSDIFENVIEKLTNEIN